MCRGDDASELESDQVLRSCDGSTIVESSLLLRLWAACKADCEDAERLCGLIPDVAGDVG